MITFAGNQIHLKFFEVKVIGCASDSNCESGEKCVNGKCVEDKNCPWNYEDFSYWGSNDCWYTCGGGTNQVLLTMNIFETEILSGLR